MTSVCQKCRKVKPGAYYEIYFGKLDSNPFQNESKDERPKVDFQGERVFICDRCVMRFKNKNNFGYLILDLMLLFAVGVGSILEIIDGIHIYNVRSFIMTVGLVVALFLCLALMVWLYFIIRGFFKKFTSPQREIVAEGVRFSELRMRNEGIWKRTNFEERLKAKFSDTEIAAFLAEIPTTNRDT